MMGNMRDCVYEAFSMMEYLYDFVDGLLVRMENIFAWVLEYRFWMRDSVLAWAFLGSVLGW